MNKYKYATEKGYLEELTKKIFFPCLNGSDNVLVALPGDGHISLIKSLIDFRNNPFRPNDIITKLFTKRKIDKSVFILVDLDRYDKDKINELYKEINYQIGNNLKADKFLKKNRKFIKNTEGEYKRGVNSIKTLAQNGFYFYFIFRYIPTAKNLNKYISKEIFSLQSLFFDQIRLVFSFFKFRRKNIPDYISNKFISTKVTYLPNLSKKAVHYQIEKYYFENNKTKDLNKKVKDFICYHSGGLGALLKALLIENLNNNSKNLSIPHSIDFFIKEINNILSDKELHFIRKYLKSKNKQIILDQNSTRYPVVTGLCNYIGLATKVVEFKEKSKNSKRTEINKNRLNNLTASEYKIYLLLKEKKGSLVERDDVAKAIWKENYKQKYSDWAIDRHMYKLRKKIPNDEKVVTKKGRGYILKAA